MFSCSIEYRPTHGMQKTSHCTNATQYYDHNLKTGKKPTAIQLSLTLASTQGDAETSFRSLTFLLKKFNVHVLFLQFQRIDEGGQLAKACREELSDEVYLERLVRVIFSC